MVFQREAYPNTVSSHLILKIHSKFPSSHMLDLQLLAFGTLTPQFQWRSLAPQTRKPITSIEPLNPIFSPDQTIFLLYINIFLRQTHITLTLMGNKQRTNFI